MSKFLAKIEADGMAVVLSDDGSRRIPVGRGHVDELRSHRYEFDVGLINEAKG